MGELATDNVVLGASLASFAIIAINNTAQGKSLTRPLVGTAIASILLAGMSVAGAKELARGFSLALLVGVVYANGSDVLKLISRFGGE